MNPEIKVIKDNVDEVMRAIKALSQSRVFVGIPSNTPARPGTPVSYATIGYVMEFGNPRMNVPPRPFLVPGIMAVYDKTMEQLKVAGELALEGKKHEMEVQLARVGQQAVNAVQTKISTGPFVPLAPSTVRARLRQTQRGVRLLAQIRTSGGGLGAWGAANLTPLVNTGSLRRSITYVIRKENG